MSRGASLAVADYLAREGFDAPRGGRQRHGADIDCSPDRGAHVILQEEDMGLGAGANKARYLLVV
jgi:hypothetical protein